MRVEATVPDNRASALQELAEELGLSRSQVIDEALALFLKAVMEIRQGRRLATLDPANHGAACELTTPTLTALEWALRPEKLVLSEAAVERMTEALKSPPAPGRRLRTAAKRRR